jgi:FAD synthetase
MVVKTVSLIDLSQPKYPAVERSSHLGTVLLHLYAGALARRLPNTDIRIRGIYIPIPSPFPALEGFIDDSVKKYKVELFRCGGLVDQPAANGTASPTALRVNGSVTRGGGMLQALQAYKVQFPDISAILIGTRRNDPHGGT